MNQEQEHLRSDAQKEFLHSLDQLQETLLTDEMPTSQAKTTLPPDRTGDRRPPAPIDAGDLEAAVADIEEFINSQQSE